MNASFNRWQLANAYGAFGTVTKERIELIVEGTLDEDPDAADWHEYGFKGKPGDVRRIPRQYAPYHLRLDWLMWFLPLGRSLDDWFTASSPSCWRPIAPRFGCSRMILSTALGRCGSGWSRIAIDSPLANSCARRAAPDGSATGGVPCSGRSGCGPERSQSSSSSPSLREKTLRRMTKTMTATTATTTSFRMNHSTENSTLTSTQAMTIAAMTPRTVQTALLFTLRD